MIPGIKASPSASMVCFPGRLAVPVSRIFPSFTAKSPRLGGEPRPSMSKALRITRSCIESIIDESLPARRQDGGGYRRRARHWRGNREAAARGGGARRGARRRERLRRHGRGGGKGGFRA